METVWITDVQVVSAVELKVSKFSLAGLLIRTNKINGKIGKNKWEINRLDRAYFNILFKSPKL